MESAAAAVEQDISTSEVDLGFSLTVLGSGSSGNCSLVSFGNTRLLIDAGFSGKETCRRMEAVGIDPDSLDAILVTHEHSDHIKSVHTLSRRFEAPIYCTEGTFNAVISEKAYFGWQQVVPGRSFNIGKMCVHPISLPHDAADPIGFRIECEGRTLGHMTDFGYGSALVRESLKGCDTLLLEANHDLEMLKNGPYPWHLKQRIAGRLGHLSNEGFYDLLPDILHEGVGDLIIAHMSHTNNDPRLVSFQTKRILRRLGLDKLKFTIAEQNTPLAPVPI